MPLPKLPELDPKKPDKDDILKSKTNVPDFEETDDDIVELTDEDFFDVEESNFQEEINSPPEVYQDKFNYKEQLPEDTPPHFPENNQDDLTGKVQAQEQQTDNQKDIQRLSNEIKNSKKRSNPFKDLFKNKGSSKLLKNKKVKYILISVGAFIGIILLMTILSKFRGNKTQDKPQVQPQMQEQESQEPQAQVQQGEPEEKQPEALQLVKKIKSSTDNESIIVELNKIKEPIELKYLLVYYQEDNNKVNECVLFDLNLDSKTKEVELKCDTQPIVNKFQKVQYLIELERK